MNCGRNSMEKYTLFLDESSDKDKGYVLVGGFAIPNSQIALFEKSMADIKKLFWSEEYINNNPTVLHCTELSLIYNNRRNPELYKYIKRDEYKFFKKMEHTQIKNIYENMYAKLCKIIKEFNVTVFGCYIDEKKFEYLFDEGSKQLLEDPYNIALQAIIENFTHFLNKKNGVGYIVYESRNSSTNVDKKSLDMRMYDNFCKIKAVSKGIPYVNSDSISNRIRYFNVVRKVEENAGVEFADFVAYNLYKSFAIGDENDKSEFIKKIENSLYNGTYLESDRDLRNFYGIRYIPEDYEIVNALKKELNTLKNAYKKIKKEKEDLMEKNDLIKNEKEELKEKIAELRKLTLDKQESEQLEQQADIKESASN